MLLHKFWIDETRSLCTHDGATKRFRFKIGSDISQADAEEKAEALFRAAEAFLQRADPTPDEVREFRDELRLIQGCEDESGEYQKPICEEILLEIDSNNVVTRNHYGAEVLNSTDTCFIDVDNVRWSFLRILKNLFASYGIGEWAMEVATCLASKPEHADLGFRVYRTAAGARVIVTGNGLDPGSERMRRLFQAFNADPRYAALCDVQRCFRARLTPKPSRMHRKPRLGKAVPFPYATESDRQEANAWIEVYNDRSEHYAVCRFLKAFGRPINDRIVDFHDEATGADTGRQLA